MGRIRKWKASLCLIFAAVFILSQISGCQSKDSTETKASVKSETAEQKKDVEKDSAAADEEGQIPGELIPGKGTQLEEKTEDAQENGTAKSVFDASDDGIASGKNPGGQENASGSTGGGDNSSAGAGGQQGQAESSEIQVSVTVESKAAGDLVSYADVLTLQKGTTAYDALIALCGDQVAASGGYVTGIGGLSEKDYGAKSGWMYSVNGTRPNKSSGSYTLQDGDEVVWSYVT